MPDAPTLAPPEKPKAKPKPKPKGGGKPEPKKPLPGVLPPYHVVLLDDDDHTYEYVIEMLQGVFGHPVEKGFKMAEEVDRTGRVIVLTTHRELAELKRDQVQGFGADARIAACKGGMRATVEPAT